MNPLTDDTGGLFEALYALTVVACPSCKQPAIIRVILPWENAYRFCYTCVQCGRSHSRDLTASPVAIARVVPPSHKPKGN